MANVDLEISVHSNSLLVAALAVVNACGHELDCQFQGCTCGRSAKLAEALLQVNKILRNGGTKIE